MADPRVIVVGAGPAGTRCAEALVAAGLRPVVIDEAQRDGGQIYRRQPEHFTRSYDTLYGSEAARASALHQTFDRLRERIDYRPQTLVWNVAERQVHAVRDAQSVALPYDALILCSGATDRLLPVKGWQLAGVYTLGGAQVALKSQGCAIGKAVVFMGTGPLLYLVAAQYQKAGAQVVAVLDTSSWRQRMSALPQLCALPDLLLQGMRLNWALRRAGVPCFSGIEPLSINGEPDTGVQSLSFRDGRGQAHTLQCDAVAMGYHLRPETQLADLAGCELRFDVANRQWLPATDADGRSTVPGVYLAGDGSRVHGARAAEVAGALAALAVLKDQRMAFDQQRVAALQRQAQRYQRFARGLQRAFPWPATLAAKLPDDVILCRCETIRVGELRTVAAQADASETNRAKAFSRVGMGRCQGRFCGAAAAEVLAAATQQPLESVGRLRTQAPVKPLPIATTAAEP
jgi:NADPH-dependent 2,4-dienoyl-CoA reductase/sulfur reductase-like enzyme